MVFGESVVGALHRVLNIIVWRPFFLFLAAAVLRRRVPGQRRLLGTVAGSETQLCVHETRCGRNSCTCEPASRSCRPQNYFVPASRHACKTVLVRLRRRRGQRRRSLWLAGMPTPSCRGASRAPRIARAHV